MTAPSRYGDRHRQAETCQGFGQSEAEIERRSRREAPSFYFLIFGGRMFYKGSRFQEEANLAEVVMDMHAIEAGENYIVVYVDCSRGVGQSIVAEMEMDLIGPVTADVAQPRRLSGFELPAQELMHLAQERAGERGVKKILLVDPRGFLRLARTNRYARR